MDPLHLKINPGMSRDGTYFTAMNRWWDGDKIRFRAGRPEKIGGWGKYYSTALLGKARSMIYWSAIDSQQMIGIGTHVKYYILHSGTLRDVTPVRASSTINNNPFSTTNGSALVTVTDTAHGAQDGDYVTFSGASTFAGFSSAQINTEFEITYVDINTYTVTFAQNASATTTGGGAAVVAAYQLSGGPDTSSTGTGWGAGVFGGGPAERTVTLGANPLAITNLSAVVTVTDTAHGMSSNDWVVLSGATTVGNIVAAKFNLTFQITVTGANTYTITVQTAATSTTSGGGSSISATYYDEDDTTGWGEESGAASVASAQLRLWTNDNWGEDLLHAPRGGKPYIWDKGNPTVRSTLVSAAGGAANVPTILNEIMVSDQRHAIAFGANAIGSADQDKLLIRWSDQEDYTVWTQSSTHTAGENRIGTGSEIITALKTNREILVWTDLSLHSMQYVGGVDGYGVTPIAQNVDIMGPMAKATWGDTTYWMGTENFYIYDGRVQILPCEVRDYVFQNLNREVRTKVYAGINALHAEVWWLYSSEAATENDRYVCYNWAEKVWYFGSLDRTAWLSAGPDQLPMAVGSDGYVYTHEFGENDGSTNPAAAIYSWIQSGPVIPTDPQKGQNPRQAWVTKHIVPDVTFRGSEGAPILDCTIITSEYAGGTTSNGDPLSVARTATDPIEAWTTELDVRIRSRMFGLLFENEQTDVNWRTGEFILMARPDGKRSGR